MQMINENAITQRPLIHFIQEINKMNKYNVIIDNSNDNDNDPIYIEPPTTTTVTQNAESLSIEKNIFNLPKIPRIQKSFTIATQTENTNNTPVPDTPTEDEQH
ncbi:unnamed protein product [Rotaria sordida]|uniref:Uncharacterized protein n=1 Tax=Rotaria sordida TaxID=392033 RepID=A0A814TL34_9BILA|nr:unnamed protein product [Rotaria sordida]CAF1415064.1 unnamed protein product [Rotaria sordida]